MAMLGKTLEIQSSPHVVGNDSVEKIMWHVAAALAPVTIFAVISFGLTGLITLLGAVGSCVATEHLLTRNTEGGSTIRDGSGFVTGLLYGLVLPPALPLWIVCVGGVISIWLGKWFFGGLGANAFNPALVGRAVLQAAFPIPMTSWYASFAGDRFTRVAESVYTPPLTAPPDVDIISAATPLSAWKFDGQATQVSDLLLGTTTGSSGETSAVLILAGGAWLLHRKLINWRTPVAILGTAALLATIFHLVDPTRYPTPQFVLLSGGLMIGAVFMATDGVGSPMTNLGCVIVGALIAMLTIAIRYWGGMPEGVMYALLLGNAASPHIDALIQPRVFGAGGRKPPKLKPAPAKAADDKGEAKKEESGGADSATPADSVPGATAFEAPPPPKAWPMYRALVGVGLLCGLLIVGVFSYTRPIIEKNRAEALQAAIFRVLPGAKSSQTFKLQPDGEFTSLAKGDKATEVVHAGFAEDGKLVGVALEASGMGYQDIVSVLVGYAPAKDAIVGMEVLTSRETPGIGDRVEKEAAYLSNFEKLDVKLSDDGSKLAHPIEVVKPGEKTDPWQVDTISGATITSKAIGKMIGRSAERWVPKVKKSAASFQSAAAGESK